LVQRVEEEIWNVKIHVPAHDRLIRYRLVCDRGGDGVDLGGLAGGPLDGRRRDRRDVGGHAVLVQHQLRRRGAGDGHLAEEGLDQPVEGLPKIEAFAVVGGGKKGLLEL
jgi:hypothetical protein